MLKIDKLMVFYENALAVNELSIHVDEGEIVGLIGSNSAGKDHPVEYRLRTHSRHEAQGAAQGRERITIVGTISFLGKDITHVWADERVKMGIVLSRERHPVFVESDVEENLKIAPYLLPREEVKERIAYVYQIFPALHPIREKESGISERR